MMSGEAWLFLLSVLINAVNLFLQVFFTIMYSDLEWWVNALCKCVTYILLGENHAERSGCWIVIISTPSISAIDSIHTSFRRQQYMRF